MYVQQKKRYGTIIQAQLGKEVVNMVYRFLLCNQTTFPSSTQMPFKSRSSQSFPDTPPQSTFLLLNSQDLGR